MELPAGVSAATLATIARAAEAAGVGALGFTDHPAPSAKWLGAGGHPTFDPFAALSFVAAITTRVRLMTNAAVLPYRNPLLLAKNVATVDCLSGGRFTLVAGTGYLRSEFAALGCAFEERNEAFEEAVEVLRSVFLHDSFAHEGRSFAALGVAQDPTPLQRPHPPIWIGGSSRTSRRRVARYGDGWAPLYVNERAATSVHTAPLSTDSALARAIDELRELVEAEGRDPASIAIQLDGAVTLEAPCEQVATRAAELGALGVTQLVVRVPRGPVERALRAIDTFADIFQAA